MTPLVGLWLLAATATAVGGPPEGPSAEEAVLALPGGSVPVWVERSDVGGPAVRFAPRVGGAQLASAGGTLSGAIALECAEGNPQLSDGTLRCAGAPRLRPDLGFPADAASTPNAAVPRVRPGDRAVGGEASPLARHLPVALALSALCLVLAALAAWALRGRPRTPMPAPRLARADLWWLAGLTALGALLRFVGLGDEALEQNEFTYVMTSVGHDSVWGVLWDVNALAQTHAPLPHLLSYGVAALAGVSEWALRLPATLAGVAAVPLVYLAAFRMAGESDRSRVALVAAAAAALSPVHAWYSQDASPYALVALAGALMLLGAESLLRGSRGGLLAAATALGFGTHYYALHLALGLYATLLVIAWRRRHRDLGAQALRSGALVGALLALWLPAFLEAYAWSKGHSTAYQREAGVYHATASLLHDALDALRLAAGVPWVLWPLAVLGVGAVGAALPRRADAHTALLVVPVLWFVLFELVNRESFLKGLYGGYYFGIRYALFLFPSLWVLAGRAAAALPGRVALPLAAAALVAAGVETTRQLVSVDKPDVRGAAAEVGAFLRPGDALLVGPAVFYQHPWHWYAAPEARRAALRVNDLMQTPEWRGGVLSVLSDLVEPYERTLRSPFIQRLVVVDHTQHLFGRREFSDRPSERLEATLSQGWRQTWRRDLHDVSIRTFERVGAAPLPPDTLHFGWDDAPWLRAAEPPGPWVSAGRRVRRDTELAVPRGVSARLRLGAAPMGPTARRAVPVTPVSLTLRADGRPLWEGAVTDHFEEISLVIPGGLGPLATIRFERGPTPPGRTPSEVVLDKLTLSPVVRAPPR